MSQNLPKSGKFGEPFHPLYNRYMTATPIPPGFTRLHVPTAFHTTGRERSAGPEKAAG